MKATLNFFLFFALTFVTLQSYGQDRITLTEGRSVECKIVFIDSTKIDLIIYQSDMEIKTSITLDRVASYNFGGKYYKVQDRVKATTYENRYAKDDKRSSLNALNLGIEGLVTTTLSLNYEHLFENRYGVMLGIPLITAGGEKEKGIQLGFRRHFRNSINSFYMGFLLDYTYVKKKVEATGYELNNYFYEYTIVTIGPNVGKRWVYKDGFNLAIRGGFGIPVFSQENWIDDPEDEEMQKFAIGVTKVVSCIDFEFTLGYAF